ncbi:MAG: hypothetical protein R6W67_12580 [Bacteroidales bacterium]
MKIYRYIGLVLLVAFSVSCEKNVIEYPATSIENKAEFQLHYFVPVVSGSANNITRIEVNDQLYLNEKTPLTTYNARPSSVGKFFAVSPGSVNFKLYQGSAGDNLVYDQNITLTAGKQNIFVHDFNQPAIVFDTGYPFTPRVTMDTDSVAWIKFYNFLYETPGVTNDSRIQYVYIDPDSQDTVKIGEPVAFGQTTGWQPVKVIKATYNSSGSRLIQLRIMLVDAAGNVTGPLQVRNSAGNYVNHTGSATLFIGRRYHHIMAGYRADTPISSVRVFTAL